MIVLQSVVLVSKLPFVALFNYLVGVIAPEFFDSGMPCLETGMPFLVLLHSLSVNGCKWIFLYFGAVGLVTGWASV